jgi:uncharacterized membrane protein YphA (DoxX/SURF4 family)
MHIAYLAVSILLAIILMYSGIAKLRRDARQVRVVHDTVGLAFKYFPVLAACEFAGAAGLVAGIWWPVLGIAAAIGVFLYFAGAVAAHLRVGDFKGIGSAAFMLVLSAAALVLQFKGNHP